ncbi:MAG: FtsX-like permease family protein [Acidobacteriaceae bacterium]|nr:FtsX-like permease family protein [Acidobacteriaceae bacterium]
MGRLKPGWTVARAKAQLEVVSPAVFRNTIPPTYVPELIKYYVAYKLTAIPAGTGVSMLRNHYSDPLYILLAIAALVLLIACANLANLMLARATAREREIAVRLAIGASRFRLVRQLLAESMLLAIIGAGCGIFLAQALVRYLVSFLTSDQDRVFVDLALDWRVLCFTTAVGVITSLLFGLTPAIRATQAAPGNVMKTNSRGLTAGRERYALRRGLVVTQVALSLMLLVGALLFTRSLHNLLTVDAGFRTQGLLATVLDTSPLKYSSERRLAVFDQLLAQARATPGVDFAALTSIIPLSGDRWNERLVLPGSPQKDRVVSNFSRISGGYFRTLGMPILEGRDFTEHDTVSSPPVAIVNETFVRKFLNGANPLGQVMRVVTGPGERPQSYQVIGLTKDAKYVHLRDEFTPTVYVAQSQEPDPDPDTIVITRSSSGVALTSLMASMRQSIANVSPAINLSFASMETQVEESLTRERLMATLSGFFGFLAAALATLGLYGVMSYMVVRRRSEIGIRIALGAGRQTIMGLILGEAGWLLGIGLAIGLVLSIACARVAAAMLYGLQPHDPLTLLLALALLASVAFLASALPARKAANLEPMAALREE